MAFQIKDRENNAISIGELDKQAAAFWGKEVQERAYASPAKPRTENESEMDYLRRSMTSNWFDIIGHDIHSPNIKYSSGWKNVKCSLCALHFCSIFDISKVIQHQMLDYVLDEHLKPFFDLIDHWESLGYTPHKVED